MAHLSKFDRILSDGEPVPTTIRGETLVRLNDEPDRATVHANGIVIDVIANEDGSVYVEAYAFERGRRAIVQHANIDRYKVRAPNIRVDLADEPGY